MTEQINPDGTWIRFTYDDAGNKTSEMRPKEGGGVLTTTYRYDLGGRLVATTDAAGVTTTSGYDLADRVVSTQGGAGQPASTTIYNALGWTLSATDTDGIVTSSIYDAAGRVTMSAVGGKTTTTVYDGCGRTVSTTDPDTKVLAYAYDAFGRTARETHTTGAGVVRDVASTYDSLSRVASTDDGLAGVTRTFLYPAAPGQGTAIVVSCAGLTTTITADATGEGTARISALPGAGVLARTVTARDTARRETGWSVGALSYSRTLDAANGRLTDLAAPGLILGFDYGATGRKTADTGTGALLGTLDAAYTYTDTGRLASDTTGGVTTTYAFDAAGNLTGARRATETTTTFAYDASSRLTTMTAGGEVTTYGWDALHGWRTSATTGDDDPVAYAYTGTGRLASFTDPQRDVEATYDYDAAGQRTAAFVREGSLSTTTTYTYEGPSLLALRATRSSGTTASVAYLYDGAGRAYAGLYSGTEASATPFVLVSSDRGDVLSLADTDGATFAAYRYDAWGAVLETTVTATAAVPLPLARAIAETQLLRYAGYCYDGHSGLYYLSARSYDPVTRQFLTKDPARADGEESAYQYCGGDPVGSTDPSGEVYYSLTDGAYSALRWRIRHWAESLVRTAKGYGPKAGYKNPNGYIDCSGAVNYVLIKAGVQGIPSNAMSVWNSGSIFTNCGAKAVPGRTSASVNYWSIHRKWIYRAGDILYSPPSPRYGHVAISLDDGTNPRIMESSPRYDGPHIHKISERWGSWSPPCSGRFFTVSSHNVIP